MPRSVTQKDNRRGAKSIRQLADLYEADETAWLEQMAQLIQERRYNELDYKNLSEFLISMAKRDRREVLHRLTTLLEHQLKWDHQPSMRSRSWEQTMKVQRHELIDLCESRTLKNHALEVLSKAYTRARNHAASETGLPEARFPRECPYSLDDLLIEA
jgi:Domain of unknown function DUF29